jgi:group I intron endonuclease
MSETREYCVYKHTNKTNGKIYIGITSQKPKRRWDNGRGYCKNQHFWRAINKYGWDGFNHEVLYSGLSENQAKVLEVSLIAYYDSTNRNKGYNNSPGGDLASEESRRKRSEALKGEKNPMYGKCCRENMTPEQIADYNRKLSENHADFRGENGPMYGKHHTEEAKEKISKANKGANNGQAKSVICITTGYYFETVTAAAKYYKIDRSDISRCCNGKKIYCGKLLDGTKLVWKYVQNLPKPQVSEEQKQLLRNGPKLLKVA